MDEILFIFTTDLKFFSYEFQYLNSKITLSPRSKSKNENSVDWNQVFRNSNNS